MSQQSPAKEFSRSQPEDRHRSLQFLTFELSSDTRAMLAATQAVEILQLPMPRITPIPGMAAWVLGAYNWRGEMIWIVDLPQLLELAPLGDQGSATAHYSIAIVSMESTYLGLAVPSVGDLYSGEPDDIRSFPGEVATPALASVLQGYILSEDEEILLVLDAEAILERTR